MTFRPYRSPVSFSDPDRHSLFLEKEEDLFELPEVDYYRTSQKDFWRFSFHHHKTHDTLIAEYDEGKDWVVVGFMDVTPKNLSQWEPKS